MKNSLLSVESILLFARQKTIVHRNEKKTAHRDVIVCNADIHRDALLIHLGRGMSDRQQ
jgi:hypothetical protein